MRVLFIISIICLSLSVKAQQKKDSIQQVQLNKYMDSVINHTSVLQLNEWLYNHLTAKEFDSYAPFFKFFIDRKQEEYLKTKN